MLITAYEYGTTEGHLPQILRNKVLLSLRNLRLHSASKPAVWGAIPDEVLSPAIEQYPREISDEAETPEDAHLVNDDKLDETPRAGSDYLRFELECVHL